MNILYNATFQVKLGKIIIISNILYKYLLAKKAWYGVGILFTIYMLQLDSKQIRWADLIESATADRNTKKLLFF